MRILIACEFSGRTRDAFIQHGHDAISCDLLPTELPGPHYQGDVRDILNDGWDMMIAHPDCTYLTISAEWAYADREKINRKLKPETLTGAERWVARWNAAQFVAELWNADIEKVCIENPRGVINKLLPFMPKAQWIQFYNFGEDASKTTGLWKRNLPDLTPTKYINPRYVNGVARWGNQTDSGQNREPPGKNRWKIRSYTPVGLSTAFAEQWG